LQLGRPVQLLTVLPGGGDIRLARVHDVLERGEIKLGLG
jgi:hypothetical protein